MGTGVKFDVAVLGQDLTTAILVPAFLILFLAIRGIPAFFYRNDITRAHPLPFALASAVPSLSLIVVITEIGVHAQSMNPDVAAALVGAALLAVLLFPTVAGVLLPRPAVAPVSVAPAGAPV